MQRWQQKEHKDKEALGGKLRPRSGGLYIGQCPSCGNAKKVKDKRWINKLCSSCSHKVCYQRWLINGTEEKRRDKISRYNKSIGKIPPSWLGKKLTVSHRKKISITQKGENGNNWNGGITPINKIIRHSLIYALWREAVFARDNWTCQKTGIRGGKLIAHHIKNFAEYPELRFAIDNGITLSDKSHKEFHKKYGKKNNTKQQLEKFLTN